MFSPTPPFVFLFIFTIIFIQSNSSPVTINLTPKLLNKSGDSVHIQWTGIDSPSKLDWLGIYSPPNSSHSDFIGYVFLSSCPNYQSGSCSTNLSLINLRSNYEFRLFRWTEDEIDPTKLDQDHNPLPGVKHLLRRSEELGFAKGNGPEQIHLAFTDNVDEMRVIFITDDGKESFVKFGRDEDELEEVAKTGLRRYEREDMCDSPANTSTGWRDPGFIHDGVLTNLKGGKKYYYKVMF